MRLLPGVAMTKTPLFMMDEVYNQFAGRECQGLAVLLGRFNLFTTITALGTPYDILLQELRIKSWFPADKMTEMNLRTQKWGVK
ncbi:MULTISPECIES: hypothetical protein [unclassified Anabaena]|uniref:hypothetical protein n=1 Tax=unclassified Anabaena TaxID=2619674 RepID=UPI0039C5BA1B